MLNDQAILIVEDDVYLALDLSMAVERSNGRVVGPVGTVAEALELMEEVPIAAAVLDSQLADRDVSPVAMALAEKGVPFVIHACIGLPAEVEEALPSAPLLLKPLHSDQVLARLLSEMAAVKLPAARAPRSRSTSAFPPLQARARPRRASS